VPNSFAGSRGAVAALPLDTLALPFAFAGGEAVEGFAVAVRVFWFSVTATLAGTALFVAADATFFEALFVSLAGFVQPPSTAVIKPMIRIAIVFFIPLARPHKK
jgi:hypothetical protein